MVAALSQQTAHDGSTRASVSLHHADLMVRWDLPSKRDGRDGPPNGNGEIGDSEKNTAAVGKALSHLPSGTRYRSMVAATCAVIETGDHDVFGALTQRPWTTGGRAGLSGCGRTCSVGCSHGRQSIGRHSPVHAALLAEHDDRPLWTTTFTIPPRTRLRSRRRHASASRGKRNRCVQRLFHAARQCARHSSRGRHVHRLLPPPRSILRFSSGGDRSSDRARWKHWYRNYRCPPALHARHHCRGSHRNRRPTSEPHPVRPRTPVRT